MYVCIYIRIYVCMYVYTYVCMYIRMYVYTYVRMYTYVCISCIHIQHQVQSTIHSCMSRQTFFYFILFSIFDVGHTPSTINLHSPSPRHLFFYLLIFYFRTHQVRSTVHSPSDSLFIYLLIFYFIFHFWFRTHTRYDQLFTLPPPGSPLRSPQTRYRNPKLNTTKLKRRPGSFLQSLQTRYRTPKPN